MTKKSVIKTKEFSLEDIMKTEEIESCGINKLTKEEKGCLLKWFFKAS